MFGGGGGGHRVDVNREVFVKIQKKNLGGGGGGWVGLGGQGGCERRIEVFVKIHKKNGGGVRGEREGSVWGLRVDVIVELKFLGKFTKKIFFYFFGGRVRRGRVGGGGGQDGCERRI